ncbi:hypothetical protein CDAR_28831 [Caerostris darwini]|uniref:Uncharacterized protein n=1 Tax=Caerostris darwini TaxID=1538125 RepID=A0AAV4N7N2_9ARAC|nr:hypothetical protein CDAR_28831 [Caerostris darwini]
MALAFSFLLSQSKINIRQNDTPDWIGGDLTFSSPNGVRLSFLFARVPLGSKGFETCQEVLEACHRKWDRRQGECYVAPRTWAPAKPKVNTFAMQEK